MNEYIIMFHIELIIIALFIMSIAISVDAYSQYKIYKIYQENSKRRWLDNNIEQIVRSIDNE